MFDKPVPRVVSFVASAALAWVGACSTGNNAVVGSSAGSTGSSGTAGSSAGIPDAGISEASSSTGSSASSSTMTDPCGILNPSLAIDDESSPNGQITLTAFSDAGTMTPLPSGETRGFWFTYGSDPATGATLTPAPSAAFTFTSFDAGPVMHAACVSSSGFDGGFAGEGFNFATVINDAGQPVAVPVDVSQYSGFTFCAMSPTATANNPLSIRVRIPDDQTYGLDPTAACHNPDAGGGCDDDFSQDDELVTSQWSQPAPPPYFLNIGQNNFGAQFATIDSQNVFGVRFEVEASEDAGGAPFQFCIAQIALYGNQFP
jgi:hypothetical protein